MFCDLLHAERARSQLFVDFGLFRFESCNVAFQRFVFLLFFVGEFSLAIAAFVHGFAPFCRRTSVTLFANFFFFFEFAVISVLRVVAREIVDHAFSAKHQQMIDNTVHKIAIVAHYDDATAEVCQVFFKELKRCNVEIVRRFVKNKEIRGLHQHQTEL